MNSNKENQMLREIRIKTSERNIQKLLEFVESLKRDAFLPIYTKVLTREEVMDEFLERLNRINAEYMEDINERRNANNQS